MYNFKGVSCIMENPTPHYANHDGIAVPGKMLPACFLITVMGTLIPYPLLFSDDDNVKKNILIFVD